MQTKKLKFQMRQLKHFWHWINERHRIYEFRKKYPTAPPPWTKDDILIEYKFTNVFRELDRVTQEWKLRYSHLLAMKKQPKDHDLFFQLCMFRFFNWPETYDELFYNLRTRWDHDRAVELLRHRQESDHEQIFTGAYIVTSSGRSDPKIETICEALQHAWENRKELLRDVRASDSMEGAVKVLRTIPTVGNFVGYEIACDMRHSKLLPKPTDINTWANPGPGAMRGIHRLMTGVPRWKGGKRPDYVAAMRQLLSAAYDGEIGSHVINNTAKLPFEMREIEHSLCEFDKYMRAKNGEGRPRSRYRWTNPEREVFDDEE